MAKGGQNRPPARISGRKARPYIPFWGGALALVVGALIIACGLTVIQTAMVIDALPFSGVLVLMVLALVKAIWRDWRRLSHGLPTTHFEIENVAAS